jgi:hypothetical protein
LNVFLVCGIPSAAVVCIDKGTNPFSFFVGAVLISFHIACFYLMREYKTTTLDTFDAKDGLLDSGINSCLDASN